MSWSGHRVLIAQKNKIPAPQVVRGNLFVIVLILQSDGTVDLTGTEASCADINMSGSAIHDRLDALHVGLPGPIGAAMRVGHLNAKLDVLVTKFALSHLPNLLALRYQQTTHRMVLYQIIC